MSSLKFFFVRSLDRVNQDDFAVACIMNESYEEVFVGGRCSKCGRYLGKMVPREEMVIEWIVDKYSKGTEVIADWYFFLRRMMISDRVRILIESEGFTGISYQPVRMVQDPKLNKPVRITSRTKRRIWLPYDGPPLHELVIQGVARVDAVKNEIEMSDHVTCNTCNHVVKYYGFPYPRRPILLEREDWDGSDFFILFYPAEQEDDNRIGRICVTERVKNAIESQKFINVKFHEFGAIDLSR